MKHTPFRSLYGVIAAICLGIAAAALILLMIIGFSDVFARYAFGASIITKENLFSVLLIIIFVASFPVITLKQEHLDVDLLDFLMTKDSIRRLQLFIINLSIAISCSVMSYWMYDRAVRISRPGREVMYEMLNWQQGWFAKLFALILAITGILMFLAAIWQLIQWIRRMPLTETLHHKDNL